MPIPLTSRCDDRTILELFGALKRRLSGISSNCVSNSAGLDLREVISLEKETLDILSLVQSLRNLSSPVGRLPVEVLEQILTVRASDRDLLTASCVCRRWRDALLSSPRLWSKFKCNKVAQTLRCLTRSEPVPVNATADFYSDIEAAISLNTAAHRLRSLTLKLQPFDLLEVFNHMKTPAPILEHLEVSPLLQDGRRFLPSIPSTFLGGFTPALKSFHLKGISTKLNFSEFPALIRLSLITDASVFDITELFGVFASAGLLEEVSVEFRGATTPIPASQGVVQLPRMRELKLSNTVGEFPKGLLSLLSMPSVEKIELDISLPGEDRRTIHDFLPPKLRNFPHLSNVDSMELDAPHACCHVKFRGPGGGISVRASRKGTQEQCNEFQSHWLGSLEPMSVADVKELTLRKYHPKTLEQCPVLGSLKAMDGLRSLVVERCNDAVVIEALSPTKGGNALFPHLGTLMFQLTTEPKTVFPGLVDMARARTGAGFPLAKVTLDQCKSFACSDAVNALQQYVGCVELNT